MLNQNCLNCPQPMYLEGYIEDDIPLCHSCYSDHTLVKYGYTDEDFLMGIC